MRTSTGSRIIARPTPTPEPTIPRWIVPLGLIVGVLVGLLTASILIVRV